MLVINLKTEQRAGNYSLLSDRLVEEMKPALQQGGKIVLFYNRKGYARRIVCGDCKHLFDCYDCKRPLAAMKLDSQSLAFICTYCKAETQLSCCHNCKGTDLKFLGFGLERIKQELEKNSFPKDSILLKTHAPNIDTLSKEDALSSGIALAALLNADTDLYLPDFTAAVKTFNHIIAFKKFCREVSVPRQLVQTYAPRHYAIYYGVRSNFEGFLKKELQERKKYSYPPYSQLIKLIYQHRNQNVCKKEAQKVYSQLKTNIQYSISNIKIFPPSPAFIPKVRGNWRWQMVIKSQKSKVKSQIYPPSPRLQRTGNSKVKSILQNLPPQWLIDVDPVSLV